MKQQYTYRPVVLHYADKENELHFVLGDFNLDCLNYDMNLYIKRFYDNIFQYGAIPLIYKPTQVKAKTTVLLIISS